MLKQSTYRINAPIADNQIPPLQELAQQRRTGELCTSYTQSRCVHGDNCRFSHDVTAYLAQKGPDLPGQCPFSAAETCPYGELLLFMQLRRCQTHN